MSCPGDTAPCLAAVGGVAEYIATRPGKLAGDMIKVTGGGSVGHWRIWLPSGRCARSVRTMTTRNSRRASTRAAVWATVFGGAGVLHFAQHRFFDALVPAELPGEQKYWTWGSGVIELGLSAAIANPSTRAAAATPASLFLLGVWPGNIKMALDWQRSTKKSPLMKAGAWARVAAQVPMIVSTSRLGGPAQ